MSAYCKNQSSQAKLNINMQHKLYGFAGINYEAPSGFMPEKLLLTSIKI